MRTDFRGFLDRHDWREKIETAASVFRRNFETHPLTGFHQNKIKTRKTFREKQNFELTPCSNISLTNSGLYRPASSISLTCGSTFSLPNRVTSHRNEKRFSTENFTEKFYRFLWSSFLPQKSCTKIDWPISSSTNGILVGSSILPVWREQKTKFGAENSFRSTDCRIADRLVRNNRRTWFIFNESENNVFLRPRTFRRRLSLPFDKNPKSNLENRKILSDFRCVTWKQWIEEKLIWLVDVLSQSSSARETGEFRRA